MLNNFLRADRAPNLRSVPSIHRLPDGSLLEGRFHLNEDAAVLYAFAREHLSADLLRTPGLRLLVASPKKMVVTPGCTLVEAGLTGPASLVHLGLDQGLPPKSAETSVGAAGLGSPSFLASWGAGQHRLSPCRSPCLNDAALALARGQKPGIAMMPTGRFVS
jgi:hypothetical protein